VITGAQGIVPMPFQGPLPHAGEVLEMVMQAFQDT
jgi:hypothetical protein